jgi:tyrosyl-tRNA synthetase
MQTIKAIETMKNSIENDDSELNLEYRLGLISSIGEEVSDMNSLKMLLAKKKNIYAYDGFEPSGRMHLAQGLMRAHNVNKFIDSGVKFKFWVADWFALMNLKLGGDIKKIQKAGHEMINIWKACGMKVDAVDSDGNPMIEFIWSSEEITARSGEYWKIVLDIATKFTLNRIKKCTQIMGKKQEKENKESVQELKIKIAQLEEIIKSKESGVKFDEIKDMFTEINSKFDEITEANVQELACSQVFYPVMQCADIFFLKIDICSLGIDQLKVNALALEYCDKIKQKNKPIIISHHMVMGLDGTKMSKSCPDNAIFMDDNPSEVKRKITKAFCEPSNIEKNPLLDWAKHIVFPINGKFVTPQNIKFNEPEMIFTKFEELEKAFLEGTVQPKGLKDGMIKHINDLLKPVQDKLKLKN